MGLFDAITRRGDRKRAAQLYEETLEYLTAEASPEEVRRAKRDAAARAGEHLDPRDQQDVDEELATRLSLEEARRYGDVVITTPLDAIVDGSWRELHAAARRDCAPWLQDRHARDQHWQAAEAAMERALSEQRVDDETVGAIDQYIAEIDPQGDTTIDPGWYRRFARARLRAGHLPRARREPRLISMADETVVFTEDGQIVLVTEFLDTSDRTRTQVEVQPVRVDASDRRIAVFGDQLVFSTPWTAIVGVEYGEDDHGPFVRLDDAEAGASHVVHSDMADLLSDVAREMRHRAS